MNYNILVIDDEKIIGELTADLLEAYGHKTLKATSGNKGIDLIKQNPNIDIIISDIRMPDGDGLAVLDYVQENNPSTSVILMTGYADITDDEALNKGAMAIIHKPFEIDDFVDIVHQILAKTRSA